MSDAADWDAASYDRLADPQEEWGREVLARLELGGDETVLDAGCGSGRTTALLLERLPRGRVIGVDASPSMIEKARETLDTERTELFVANLLDLRLDRPVDAIFSNATFHWISDHDRLFARLFDALRPGGVIEAQCGGRGNVEELKNALISIQGDERFAPYLRTMEQNWNFAGVADTQTRLERAGFDIGEVWLEERTVVPPDPGAYIAASGLAGHLERLPDELRQEFVDTLIGSLPRPITLQYVRLNISARRPQE
jgi:trans-aconitate 2-methyltransferase